MIRFEMNDGTIVPAEQDCGCVTHEGPHWVHMDRLDKAANQTMLERGQAYAFAASEIRRLNEKLTNMNTRGISRIIETEDPDAQADA